MFTYFVKWLFLAIPLNLSRFPFGLDFGREIKTLQKAKDPKFQKMRKDIKLPEVYLRTIEIVE